MKRECDFSTWIFVEVVAIIFVLTGCATVRSSHVDVSGGKITSALVYGNFVNVVTKSLSEKMLSDALSKAVCDELAKHIAKCETVNANQAKPPNVEGLAGASHLIIVYAKLDRAHYQEQYWDDCLHLTEHKRCIGGMDTRDVSANASVTVTVIEKQRKKTIFESDRPQSFYSDDENAARASAVPAAALVRGLKDAGLL
jgi:hypothetical protein